ncbi:MAG: ABC transporter ATP-binding protein [Candidatus Bathyarchaeia archaeon]
MIEVEELIFRYPNGFEALRGVDLRIGDGEFVAIMGENGAGKTTLVKHFNGLLKPTRGRVLIDGLDTKDASVAELSRSVGLVFQNPDRQLFSETVRDEVAFALRNFGFSEEIIEKRVERILRLLDLSEYADTSPFLLSGGERKRVALASVLVWDPKHVVLDEPTIGQDYLQKERLRNLIMQINNQGKTVVIVTHDVEFVAEAKPRVVLMSKGSIMGDGRAEEILSDRELVDRASLIRPQISELVDSLSDRGLPRGLIDAYSARSAILKLLGGRGGCR